MGRVSYECPDKARARRRVYHLAKMAEAREDYALLVFALGGECNTPTERCKGNVEVDHKRGKNYDARALGYIARIKRLWEEFLEEKLQLLCRFHNAQKNQHMLKRMGYTAPEGFRPAPVLFPQRKTAEHVDFDADWWK